MEQNLENETDPKQSDEPACCTRTNVHAQHGTSVTIEPSVNQWALALSSYKSSPAREEIGLDTDRAIVMSGHQPIVFHNGILAKLIALDEASKRFDAQAVWIVPDMDAINPGQIRVPIGKGETLRAELIELYESHADGVAAASHRAMEIQIPSGEYERLDPLIEWVDQFATLDTLAEQFAFGTIEYACELLGIDTPRIVFASELMGSQTLRAVIERMKTDPLRCVQAYNRAVMNHPDAGVRAMKIDGDVIELPLWGCRTGQPRIAIDTNNVDSFEFDELLPRGLLMSALARLHLADLFIHGTGGYVYDRISEEWFADWMGESLSPMSMVTATHRLELGFDTDEIDSMQSPQQAKWTLHHAKHSPSVIGLDDDQRVKDEMVAEIDGMAPKSQERAIAYRKLQDFLVNYRESHQDALDGIAEQAKKVFAFARQRELARDRTWSFVFFDQESLQVLDHATRDAMN